MSVLSHPHGKDVYHCSRYGKQGTVEAVQKAAMPWQDIAAVLDTKGALDLAFNQVAPCSEDGYDEGKAYPLPDGHRGFENGYRDCYEYGKETTAYAAYPTFLGRDTWEQPVWNLPAQKRTYTICTCVTGPQEQEYCQWIHPYVCHSQCSQRVRDKGYACK